MLNNITLTTQGWCNNILLLLKRLFCHTIVKVNKFHIRDQRQVQLLLFIFMNPNLSIYTTTTLLYVAKCKLKTY